MFILNFLLKIDRIKEEVRLFGGQFSHWFPVGMIM